MIVMNARQVRKRSRVRADGGDSGEACVAKQIDAKSQINLQAADQLPNRSRLRRVAQSVARLAFMHNQQAGLTNGAAYISPAAGVPLSVCAGVCASVCVCVCKYLHYAG